MASCQMPDKLRLIFVLYLSLVSLPCCASSTQNIWITLNENDGSFDIAFVKPFDYVAKASFTNKINQTGWANLDITTSSGYSDSQQVYAAGYAEGYITRSLIKMHWHNTMAGFCVEPLTSKCESLKFFLQENIKWVKQAISNDRGLLTPSPYWHHVKLNLEQIAGLQDGFVGNKAELNMNIENDIMGLYLFQVAGDLEDLNQLFGKSISEAVDPSLSHGTGRCSALLRLLPDMSDLYVAQDTWNDLPSMLRILKRYSFQLHRNEEDPASEMIPGHTMTFSSYPGMLMSGDDFYSISSGIITQETTIGNSNPALLSNIQPASVLEGIRSMVANRLASSGKEWAQIFEMHNSGTYNNQWMIVDYKRFEPFQKRPLPGLFYLVEQIPGTIMYDDLSDHLYNATYYGSYNVAFFPEIFNKSGMLPLVKQYGDWFTYDKSPRALIFKRDAIKVTDLDSMTKLMRYNNYKEDPLSRCNCTPPYTSENTIACRDDLNPANGTYPFAALGHRPHVATDMKLTSYHLAKDLSFLAVSGPTFDPLPPFQWSTSDYAYMAHVGHPDKWTFPRVLFNGSDPMS